MKTSGKPSMPQAEADAVREVMRDLIATRFGGVQQALADALGVSAPTVSDALNGINRPGYKLMPALARLTGRSEHELRGLAPAALPAPAPQAPRSQRAIAAAFARGKLPDDAIERVLAEEEPPAPAPEAPWHWWFDRMKEAAMQTTPPPETSQRPSRPKFESTRRTIPR